MESFWIKKQTYIHICLLPFYSEYKDLSNDNSLLKELKKRYVPACELLWVDQGYFPEMRSSASARGCRCPPRCPPRGRTSWRGSGGPAQTACASCAKSGAPSAVTRNTTSVKQHQPIVICKKWEWAGLGCGETCWLDSNFSCNL